MKIKNLRWWVVGLIALATVINYIDRQSLNVLWPEIAEDLYPDKSSTERKEIYSWISVIFVFSYAFGQAIFGKIFDWIGTRLGFVLSIGVWSIATALHAIANSFGLFAVFRAILGVSEAGNWPGATKGNAEWFPIKERAFAQGIFNSGAAIGGIISIPLIAFLSIYFSWKVIFILVGITGLLWLIPWLILVKSPPKKHPWITEEEREYILSGQKVQTSEEDEQEATYNPDTGELLSHKQSWGVIIASAAIDPIWWLFVFWIPIYLNEVYGMDVKAIGIYGWVPYVGAMLGAWFGGLLAQNRIKSGWTIDKTRKTVITLGCLIMLPSLLLMANPGGPTQAVLIMAVILFL
jgi:ACS family hexuronate transporter-like MFS transporter